MGEKTDFILGVDLDGVCGDYSNALRRVVAERRGIPVDDLPRQQTWDFEEWGLGTDEFHEAHKEAVLEHRIFRSMPLIDGAADALWRLSDAGVWIRIITHRLYVNWGHAVAVADTVTWLDSVGIPYRDLCFLGAKPQVEADCYIDDAPHNITALRDSGAYVLIFDQPYNRHMDGPRAESWAQVEELVGERMTTVGLTMQAALPGFEDTPDRLHRRVQGEPGEPGELG